MSRPSEPQKLTTALDGKTAKLRASCDACNESKVRCSQTKPICARCEKNDILCIYGLSRRTHRTAPRIGALAASRPRSNSNSISNSMLQQEGRHETPSSTRCGSVDSPGNLPTTQPLNGNGNSVTDNMFLRSLDLLSDFDMPDFCSNDYTVSPTMHLSMDPMQTIPTPPNGLFSDHRASLSSSDFDSPANLFALTNTHLMSEGSSSESSNCNCSTGVIRKLLLIPLSLQDGRASIDVQLSELKQAIKACEDCIQCECASRDDMTIMTLIILVGRIVKGFEASLPNSDLSRSSSCSNMATESANKHGFNAAAATPRLSWGVLEMENEDEDDLKQHLWLLHFRKLEGLLEQLGTFIRLMQSTQAHDDSAHVMACGFILLWLKQKAQVVRDILVHRKAVQFGERNK